MIEHKVAGWLLVLSLALTPLYGQEDKKAEAGQPSKTAPKTMQLYDVPSAREVNSQPPEEVAEYFKITQTQDHAQRAELIEEFLKKYPESQYVPTLHQMATASYQQLNNFEKMVEHGEETLRSLPSNPTMLSLLALAYASHGDADKATERASRAITVLEKLTIPANADPAQFAAQRNQYLASNYACLGSASLTQFETARKLRLAKTQPAADASPPTADKGPAALPGDPVPAIEASQAPVETPAPSVEAIQLAKSEGYFSRALELNPSYDFAQFQLGVVYAYQNRADKAMEAFARSIVFKGGFADMARQNLEAIYKVTHKDSVEGMEDFIARFKPPVPVDPAK